MILCNLETFKGIAPKVAPHLLAENFAQVAENLTFDNGAISTLKAVNTVWTPTKVGTVLTIYRYLGQYWFHWITDVDVVRGPIAGDAYSRTYFTGDGVPKMTESSIATTGGGTDYPINSYILGIPAPAAAPTTTVDGTADPDPPTDGTVDTRAYVYTYVSAYGEEGPPSTPSYPLVDVAPGQHVDLSAMSTAPTGAYNITAKRIYRTNTGSSGTQYQLVAEIAVATTTYADTKASADLGDVLASTDWIAPPDDMAGLCAMPNGILAGFSGNQVCFSYPYQPHAWPLAYRRTTDYPIKAIGAFGSSLLVTTEEKPYLITCQDPANIIMEKLEESRACVAKRSMVDMGYSLVYACADGLMQVGTGKMELATRDHFTKDEWSLYNPTTIRAWSWKGKYVGFYDDTGGTTGAGFIFDPMTKDFTDLSIWAKAGWQDQQTGNLYLVVSGVIVQFDAHATNLLTTDWKSRPVLLNTATNPGAAMVHADSYPVTFKLYADGTLKHTYSVPSDAPFRLPSGYRARKLEVEVTGTVKVNKAIVASTVGELARL